MGVHPPCTREGLMQCCINGFHFCFIDALILKYVFIADIVVFRDLFFQSETFSLLEGKTTVCSYSENFLFF